MRAVRTKWDRADKKREANCLCNPGVCCDTPYPAACAGCGWNPEVAAKRRGKQHIELKTNSRAVAAAAPIVHGQWLGKPTGFFEVLRCSICSACTPTSGITPNFCPNCGAKMNNNEEKYETTDN